MTNTINRAPVMSGIKTQSLIFVSWEFQERREYSAEKASEEITENSQIWLRSSANLRVNKQKNPH